MPPDSLSFPPSPLIRLTHSVAEKAGVRWYVKRDDLYGPGGTHQALQGNKVRKLAGVLSAWRAQINAPSRLLTFGGAYSNHLIASATAGKLYGLSTIGLVRGERVHNPVLDACAQAGMELHFVDRTTYREKNNPAYLADLRRRFGPVMIVPEGGSGPLSKTGLAGLVEEINSQINLSEIDYFQLAAGTGGTAAGIIDSFQNISVDAPQLEVFPVLKGGWMKAEIERQLTLHSSRWSVIDGYHFGGYAKQPPALLDFCEMFSLDFGVRIEAVYTGKLFFGVLARMKAGLYAPGSTLVTYHSGGIF